MMLAGRLLLQSLDWAQFRQVLDSLPIRVTLFGREHHYLYAGDTIAGLFGEQIFADVYPWAERAVTGEARKRHGWVELPQERPLCGIFLLRCVTPQVQQRDTSSSIAI
jgi:hypothetical protein